MPRVKPVAIEPAYRPVVRKAPPISRISERAANGGAVRGHCNAAVRRMLLKASASLSDVRSSRGQDSDEDARGRTKTPIIVPMRRRSSGSIGKRPDPGAKGNLQRRRGCARGDEPAGHVRQDSAGVTELRTCR